MKKKLAPCKICGSEIAKNASVCPHCGAKRKKGHPIIGTIVVLFGIFCIFAAIGGLSSIPDDAVNTVTKEEFDKLQTGMTYKEVVEIIGFEGELSSQVDIGAGAQYKTEIYTWSNLGGSNMNATFQGGKMISKAQIALP